MNYALLLLLLVFWKPIAMTAMLVFHKIKGDELNFTVYLGNLKAWALQLWDLVKWPM